MKVTLHIDIKADDGTEFEREAVLKLTRCGEWFLNEGGEPRKASYGHGVPSIVLTPKKPKQWLLTAVATYTEATKSRKLLHLMGLAMDPDTDGATYWASDTCTDVQWLRRTEHEAK